MEDKKEYCCELITSNEIKIWYFDTYMQALDKLRSLQNANVEMECLFAGKTENKDRRRDLPIVLMDEEV